MTWRRRAAGRQARIPLAQLKLPWELSALALQRIDTLREWRNLDPNTD
jgi:hypothetical protein